MPLTGPEREAKVNLWKWAFIALGAYQIYSAVSRAEWLVDLIYK